MKTCDKCDGEIVKGRCSCGVWGTKEDFPEVSCLIDSMELYARVCKEKNDYSPLGGTDTNGICIMLFTGDPKSCDKVKRYIKTLSVESCKEREEEAEGLREMIIETVKQYNSGEK